MCSSDLHIDCSKVVAPNPDDDIPWGPGDTVTNGVRELTIRAIVNDSVWINDAYVDYECGTVHRSKIKRIAIAEIKVGDRVWYDGDIWYVGYFYKDSGYHLQRVVEWNKMKETWAKRNQIVKVALQN